MSTASSNPSGTITIAIEGCCHGELDKIYATIAEAESKSGKKVELLIGIIVILPSLNISYILASTIFPCRLSCLVSLVVCGDFQCVKDSMDLSCVAVPQKYRKLNTFHKYVSGEKVAPILTVFIGNCFGAMLALYLSPSPSPSLSPSPSSSSSSSFLFICFNFSLFISHLLHYERRKP